ncbi:MAG: pyridoxal phosphate-dependent aminotransferase [Oscillospiraceae bacterium]|nr:pyridoxal phosphate-dependent aminotransferase [Oscillospiraceae bacterium]
MHLATMLQNIEPQLARRLFDKAKAYSNVIDLTLGDPDFQTPEHVKAAGIRALEQNKTKYTANAGILELRQAIAEDVKKRLSVEYDPNTEIICTIGAMGALYLASICTLNPGDEMIVLAPHWPNYNNMVKMCHAVPVHVNIYGEENLKNLRQNLLAAITPKTKALILNTPSNPTGQILEWEHLQIIADIAKAHDLTVFSDEVYHTILFEGEHRSIVQIEGMRERTILIESLSKRYSMTGWRVGFAAAPADMINYMVQLNEDVAACVPMFCQYGAIEALRNGDAAAKEMCEGFRKRCRFMTDALNSIPGLRCAQTKGTFYLMVDIRGTGMTSEEFAYALLEQEQVALVPGNAFDACGEGYVRIACTVDVPVLEEAAQRIRRFVANIK